MIVTLYNYQGDERRINKSSKTLEKIVNMNPVDATNLLSPSFTIDYDASILNANYAVVDDFNHRSYFVSPPTLIRGGRLEFQFRVDVTQTPDFLTILGTIKRNEFVKNAPVNDDMYPLKVGEQEIQTIWLNIKQQSNISRVTNGIYGMVDYLLTK